MSFACPYGVDDPDDLGVLPTKGVATMLGEFMRLEPARLIVMVLAAVSAGVQLPLASAIAVPQGMTVPGGGTVALRWAGGAEITACIVEMVPAMAAI